MHFRLAEESIRPKQDSDHDSCHPFFSIGITTYDRFDLLKQTVSSVLNQNFNSYELLIGNDNQQRTIDADSLGFLDKRIRYINHSKNLGCLANMNDLLGLSRGKYFTWFADDDMLFPSYLERIYNEIKKRPFVKCIFSNYISGSEYPNNEFYSKNIPIQLSGREWLNKYLTHEFITQGSAGMFEKKYLQNKGGMQQLGNSSLSPYSDNLLAIMAGMLDEVIYIPDPLFFYRIHSGAVSVASIDPDAYISAQKDLIPICVEIFGSESLKTDKYRNAFLLFQWCIADLFKVIRRSGKIRVREIWMFICLILKNRKVLKSYQSSTLRTILNHILKLFTFWVIKK